MIDFAKTFRGRPYTRPIVFNVTFTGAAGEAHAVWFPLGAHFEIAALLAKGTAAVELQIADTTTGGLIGFIGLDGVNFAVWTPGYLAGIRSNNAANAALLLVDTVGVAGTVHGTCYGWEVTKEGNYR
jgi:hypothetical protein